MTESDRGDRYRDGSGWEQAAGYSRAARRRGFVAVSGTTATTNIAGSFPHDTELQTRDAIERALAALAGLGGVPSDVIRTRMFLAPRADWQAASRAHADLLGEIAPANTTLHVHELIGDDFLIEFELDAVVAEEARDER